MPVSPYISFKNTRRYGPLRGPTSSSFGGLRPSADLFMLFWPIFRDFWCSVVTVVTFSSNFSNFERNKKSEKNPKKIQKKLKKSKKMQKKSKKSIKNLPKSEIFWNMVKNSKNPEKCQKISKIHFFSKLFFF